MAGVSPRQMPARQRRVEAPRLRECTCQQRGSEARASASEAGRPLQSLGFQVYSLGGCGALSACPSAPGRGTPPDRGEHHYQRSAGHELQVRDLVRDLSLGADSDALSLVLRVTSVSRVRCCGITVEASATPRARLSAPGRGTPPESSQTTVSACLHLALPGISTGCSLLAGVASLEQSCQRRARTELSEDPRTELSERTPVSAGSRDPACQKSTTVNFGHAECPHSGLRRQFE